MTTLPVDKLAYQERPKNKIRKHKSHVCKCGFSRDNYELFLNHQRECEVANGTAKTNQRSPSNRRR